MQQKDRRRGDLHPKGKSQLYGLRGDENMKRKLCIYILNWRPMSRESDFIIQKTTIALVKSNHFLPLPQASS